MQELLPVLASTEQSRDDDPYASPKAKLDGMRGELAISEVVKTSNRKTVLFIKAVGMFNVIIGIAFTRVPLLYLSRVLTALRSGQYAPSLTKASVVIFASAFLVQAVLSLTTGYGLLRLKKWALTGELFFLWAFGCRVALDFLILDLEKSVVGAIVSGLFVSPFIVLLISKRCSAELSRSHKPNPPQPL